MSFGRLDRYDTDRYYLNMTTLNWGIIGLGRFGAIHASAVQSVQGCRLAAICNHNPERLAAAAKQFPEAPAFADYRELLARQDIDIVSITTHWKQHFEIAVAALKAGKHVFLEKPMAETSEQCRELVALSHESPGHFMIGHICRFDPRVTLARDAIVAGQIGRIVSMHAKRNLPVAPGNIRLDKISPLMGDGIHDADMMMWFMGRGPSRVYAKNIQWGDYEYPDLGWAMLEFDDDAVGVIETIWCLPENVSTVIDARLQVIGTNGMLTIDCSDTGFHLIAGGVSRQQDTVFWPEQHGRRIGAIVRQLECFVHGIRCGIPQRIVTAEEACRAVQVMEMAEQSAKTGQPAAVPH